MVKKSKKVKSGGGTNVSDTSRAKEPKLKMVGKELRIDKQLDKKKDVKEKDVFDFSYKK
mgnify:CR=1 FL=1|tara:strand:- start:648 stop:824 length:177 start_codon:yes stop_codon:yes gene_type:complete